MALPGLLPSTDFKKTYNFHWQLQGLSNFLRSITEDATKGKINVKAVAFNAFAILNMLYVSQLAKEIDLPDDEVDIEKVGIGLVEYPVIKSVKMDDIKVTYLEDTHNTVYDFHKMWQASALDKDKGFSLKAIEPYTMEGWYIPQDKSKSELAAMVDGLTGGITNSISRILGANGAHVYNPITDSGVTELTQVRGVQIYPKIFPTKISRGTMRKDGTEVATVSVTYVRVPKIMNDGVLKYPVRHYQGITARRLGLWLGKLNEFDSFVYS